MIGALLLNLDDEELGPFGHRRSAVARAVSRFIAITAATRAITTASRKSRIPATRPVDDALTQKVRDHYDELASIRSKHAPIATPTQQADTPVVPAIKAVTPAAVGPVATLAQDNSLADAAAAKLKANNDALALILMLAEA